MSTDISKRFGLTTLERRPEAPPSLKAGAPLVSKQVQTPAISIKTAARVKALVRSHSLPREERWYSSRKKLLPSSTSSKVRSLEENARRFYQFRRARKAVKQSKEVTPRQATAIMAIGERKHESRRFGLWFPPGAAEKTAVTVGSQRKFAVYESKTRVHPLVVLGKARKGVRSVSTQTDKPGTKTAATQLAGAAHGGRISQRKQAGKPFQPWQKCVSVQANLFHEKKAKVQHASTQANTYKFPKVFDRLAFLREDLNIAVDSWFPIGDRYRIRQSIVVVEEEEVASGRRDPPEPLAPRSAVRAQPVIYVQKPSFPNLQPLPKAKQGWFSWASEIVAPGSSSDISKVYASQQQAAASDRMLSSLPYSHDGILRYRTKEYAARILANPDAGTSGRKT